MERLSDAAIEIVNDLHMERLDYNSEYIPLIDALNRLAAYEDTGMEPEEVKAKCAWADNVCKMLSGIFEDSGVFDFSHIKELITAEQEGRLVVLPCKVGDVVYELDRRILQVFRIIPPSAAFIMSEIENGIEFYKTREEAEKALEGVSDDG